MKSVISIAVIFFLYSALIKAQFKKGDWELGMCGSFGSLSVTNSYSYNFSNYSSSNSNSKRYSYAIIAISPAYYIADGISIEPELGLFAIEDQSPGEYIIGNLSYTYLLPDSKTAIFAHAGYGISNCILFTYNDIPYNRASQELDVKLVNLGAGVKFLVTPSVILKSEVNYLIQNYERDFSDSYSSSQTKMDINHISLLFGFAILL
jgi:hypothetical protein